MVQIAMGRSSSVFLLPFHVARNVMSVNMPVPIRRKCIESYAVVQQWWRFMYLHQVLDLVAIA